MENLPLKVFWKFADDKPFVIYMTGDGGWNEFSKKLANSFLKSGYNVVALNSRTYFWESKTPEQFAADIELIANHYLKLNKSQQFIVVGYSFGADVGAFLPTYLNASWLKKILSLTLISPSLSTDFEVKISDLLVSFDDPDRKYKIVPELYKSSIPILCLFGKEEDLKIKNQLKKTDKINVIHLPGSHRYSNNTDNLCKIILKE
jgi:type IV secretory pathway VirJ component